MLMFSLIRVCLPMFTLAFDDVLFRFQYRSPADEPRGQYPPTMAMRCPASQ